MSDVWKRKLSLFKDKIDFAKAFVLYIKKMLLELISEYVVISLKKAYCMKNNCIFIYWY